MSTAPPTLIPDITPVFVALADPTRRQLLDLLAEAGFASATALAAHVPVTRQAVLKHLRVLEDAAIVGHERSGREVRYHVRPEPLTASAQLAHRPRQRLGSPPHRPQTSRRNRATPAGHVTRGARRLDKSCEKLNVRHGPTSQGVGSSAFLPSCENGSLFLPESWAPTLGESFDRRPWLQGAIEKRLSVPEVHTLLTGLAMGEVPRWHDDRLWLSDMGAGEVIACDLTGASEVIARVQSLGIAFLPDGRLLIVSMREGKLLRRESDGSLALMPTSRPLALPLE